VSSIGHYHFCCKERTFEKQLINDVVIVVLRTTGSVVKRLHPELTAAFPFEVHQAADREVVGAGELVQASVEEHVAFPVEKHLDRPPAEDAARFRKCMLAGSLPVRYCENFWKAFLT
jgi:hypothetical protein